MFFLALFSHSLVVIGSHVGYSVACPRSSEAELRQYRLWKGRFLLLARLSTSIVRVLVWSATEAVMPCWKRRRRSTTASRVDVVSSIVVDGNNEHSMATSPI